LAAVQALYQQAMGGTPQAKLLAEFHAHRLGQEDPGAEHDGALLMDADREFFDDLVAGTLARRDEIDALITQFLGHGWSLARLDRLMLQILRSGGYELLARPDIPANAVVSEYVDVAHAFYPQSETGFVNALLDRLARELRPPGPA
jgi:N utilization substance protein B